MWKSKNWNGVYALALAGSIVAALSSVYSQEIGDAIVLRWGAVPESSAYRVQVRDEAQNVIVDARVATTELILRLEPGRYTYRLSSENGSGILSPWSEWFEQIVLKTGTPVLSEPVPRRLPAGSKGVQLVIPGRNLFSYTKVVIRPRNGSEELIVRSRRATALGLELNLDTGNPGSYDLLLQNPLDKNLRAEAYIRVVPGGLFPNLANLVPGLPQIRKERGRGYAYMAAFAGLGAAGLHEWHRAERIVVTRENDIVRRLVNDPIFYYLLSRSRLSKTPGGPLFQGAIYLKGREQAERYESHQSNQRAIGSAAALFYIAHWIDVLFFLDADGRASGPRVQLDIATDGEGRAAAAWISMEFAF